MHVLDGRRNFLRIAEIPEPFQGKFKEALHGSACPVLEGEGDLAYAWNWEAWTEGSWASRTKAADFLERQEPLARPAKVEPGLLRNTGFIFQFSP